MMRLRPARSGDEEAVAAVHARSWQVGYRGILADDYLDRLTLVDRLAHHTFAERGPGWPETTVAVNDGQICGFAITAPCLDPDKPDAGELRALHVHPDWWSRGVGRLLIGDVWRRFAEQGFAEAVLWVFVGNERAERFYRIDGWVPDGHRRFDEVFGITVDEVRYVRRLI
jgi:GNAT superfamily N-acetyltransferase